MSEARNRYRASSAARNRYQRLRSNESESYNQVIDDYVEDEDRQDLLPPPPEPWQNNAVKYVIKKFGWWILVVMFPYIFAPIIALRNLYSRSKRGYLAARYAHDKGYTTYLWTSLPIGLTQFVITAVWVCTMGKYDLTSFFEKGVNSSPQRRYNLRRRNRDTDSDTISQDSFQDQYTSQDQLIDDDNSSRRKEPTGVFAPVQRAWNFVKMCGDLLLLGFYFVFGWTFGRFTEDEGQLKTRKQAKKDQLSRNGSFGSKSVTSGNEDPKETRHESSSRWPWIIVAIILLILFWNLFLKHHDGKRHSPSY